jgi:segregation and condensation protein B
MVVAVATYVFVRGNSAQAAMYDQGLRRGTVSAGDGLNPHCGRMRAALARQAAVSRRNLRRFLAMPDGEAQVPLKLSGRTGDHRLQRLESVLFLSREPLTTRKLSQYANLADGTEARTLIGRLNELYDASGRSFRVERVAGGYQLLTRPHFAAWVRRLEYVPHETRLSAPALETLSVIAYRQPVLRAEIEAIRGVNCGEILRQLMERDLVRIGGRSEDLGRPYLYTTTRRFLLMFGLDSLECLPRVEAMKRDGSEVIGSRHDDATGYSRSSKAGEMETTQKGEDFTMPMGTLSGLDREETLNAMLETQRVAPSVTAFDEEDDDYDEFYDKDDDLDDDEEDDEEDVDDEIKEDFVEEEDEFEELDEEEDDDEDEDEEDDFEEEDEWEEVDDEEDDDDWDDEDEDDWDDELDDDEEEEEDEDWE